MAVAAPVSDPIAVEAIRPGRTGDIPALLALEAACFDSDRLSRRSFNHMLTRAKAALYVAEDADGLAGYGLVLFHAGTALARLYSMAVAPRARGQGLARRLLAHAETEAKSHDCIALRLEVRADNEAAIRLYESAGYRRLAPLPGYYDDDGDGWRYQKPIRYLPEPTAPQVPYIHQTTEFTCGSASLMMAMAALRPDRDVDPLDELRIWREATTVFMTSGHGGCGPHGLALAAHGRGFKVRAFATETGPLFLDSVRSAEKKRIMTRVHAAFEADLAAAGLAVETGPVTPELLETALDDGWIPLLLVSTWHFNREKVPHWVVVTGVDDRFLLVHDPDMDEELLKTDVDCSHVPIPRRSFDKISRYGRARLQAAVMIHQ